MSLSDSALAALLFERGKALTVAARSLPSDDLLQELDVLVAPSSSREMEHPRQQEASAALRRVRERCGSIAARVSSVFSQWARSASFASEVGTTSFPLSVDSLVEDKALVSDLLACLYEQANVHLEMARAARKKIHRGRSHRGSGAPSLATDSASAGTFPSSSTSAVEKNRKSLRMQVHIDEMKRPLVLRPQLLFADDVDNSNSPFVPKIRNKCNALVPLDIVFRRDQKSSDADSSSNAYQAVTHNAKFSSNVFRYPHPYGPELNMLSYDSRPDLLCPVQEVLYKTLEETPCIWVETEEDLKNMAVDLDSCSEFAIDLEHHSYRSFLGFLCLMQITTPFCDYLIDTLELRRHLHILNSSFTNPKIVKVLHGASSDVIWLQRDLGLYLVNVFDTAEAALVLEFPNHGLAFVLNSLCGIVVDKKYQKADWRIRPLPQEMLKYAREDTHYLLYVYQRMRNLLIDLGEKRHSTQEYLLSVWNRSKEICARVFEKEIFTEDSYLESLQRQGIALSGKKLNIYRGLFKWRNFVARVEDESVTYVFPEHLLLRASESDVIHANDIVRVCKPVPALVRKYADILDCVLEKSRREIFDFDTEFEKISSSLKGSNSAFAFAFGDVDSRMTPERTSRRPSSNEFLDPGRESPVMSLDEVRQAAGWIHDSAELETAVHRILYDVPYPLDAPFGGGDYQYPLSSVGTMLSESPLFGSDGANLFSNSPIFHHRVDDIASAFSSSAAVSKIPIVSLSRAEPPASAVRTSSKEDHGTEEDEEDENQLDTMLGMDSDTAAPSPSDVIPKSLAEIHKMSKLRRKRNRERKRVKDSGSRELEDCSSPSLRSSQISGERTIGGDGDIGPPSKLRASLDFPLPSSSSTADDVRSFLREVGWLSSSSSVAAPSSYASESHASSFSSTSSLPLSASVHPIEKTPGSPSRGTMHGRPSSGSSSSHPPSPSNSSSRRPYQATSQSSNNSWRSNRGGSTAGGSYSSNNGKRGSQGRGRHVTNRSGRSSS